METTLVTLIDDLQRHLDGGEMAPLLLLDLTTSFNTIDHDVFNYHLADTGI